MSSAHGMADLRRHIACVQRRNGRADKIGACPTAGNLPCAEGIATACCVGNSQSCQAEGGEFLAAVFGCAENGVIRRHTCGSRSAGPLKEQTCFFVLRLRRPALRRAAGLGKNVITSRRRRASTRLPSGRGPIATSRCAEGEIRRLSSEWPRYVFLTCAARMKAVSNRRACAAACEMIGRRAVDVKAGPDSRWRS